MRRFLEQTEKGKKGGPSLPVEKEGFSYFTYGLLGRRIGKLLGVFGGLKTVLSLAGMKIGFKAYVSSMVFAAMLGGGISFFVWFLILNLGLGSALGLSFTITSILLEIVLSIAFAVMTGAVILGVFYMLPYMKVGSRRNRLDQFLPFTSSYMTVLASAGVTPERILRSTAEKDPKFMLSDEIANVIGRIDLLGYDVINAMNAEVERSPSSNYQDLLRGFAGVIRTGGDMKKFFQGITDHLFQKRALSVQSFLDSLGIIAETYVLMLIAFPLMLVVMLSIMASIGGNLGGVDVFSFMYLLAFILIPICGVMFLFILDTMQPKG
jgi:flagellar protein FlaJ